MMVRLIGLFIAIGLNSNVFSQNYLFKHFGSEDGLNDKFINSITQCHQGYLWFSTSNGLMRYDGQQFEKLETGLKNDEFINASAVDKDGNLYFGTFSGKLIKFTKTTEKFSAVVEQVGGSVNKIIPSTSTNFFYIISKGNGVYILKEDKISALIKTSDFLINDLHELNDGYLLLSTSDGLMIYETKSQKKQVLKGFESEAGNIRSYKNNTNTCWVNIPERGIVKLEFKNIKQPVVSVELNEKINPNFKNIANFYLDEENDHLFLIGKDERLSHFNLKNSTFRLFSENEFFGSANCLFIGRQKNLWIGTAGKGLYRVHKAEFDIIETEKKSVYAIAEDADSKLYFGLEDGIRIIDKQNKFIEHITQLKNKPFGKVSALHFDGLNLWVGTNNNGLFVFNPTTKTVVTPNFSSIKNIGVNSICGNKTTVIVTTNLDGVYIYKNGILVHNYSVKNSLLHNNVFHAAETNSGKTYYATHNTAFNYSEKDELFEINVDQNGLITDYNVFAENSKNQLFVGTNGDGIYLINDTAIVPFEFNSKLESKFINGLIFDEADNLWIQHQYGLQEYFPQQKVLRKVNFPTINQLLFNSKAHYKTNSGDLLFGTSNCVIRINNRSNSNSYNYANGYINQIKINDKSRDLDSLIELSYGKYNLSIDFSAIGQKNSEGIQFKFYLEGRDNTWCEPTRQKHVEFSNLSEGIYVFYLKAINSDGFEEANTVKFKIVVDVPFWKKPWVWLLAIVLITILVVMIVNWRTASLVKIKLRLEEIVDNQTKQLRAEKELVEQNSKVIEEQNHEITQSINYAKRIQEAILPIIHPEKTNHPELMVYYVPKDIVSGDFYWYTSINNHFLVAACDCTGHGVPGAFMSLIGSTALNKIVIDKGKLNPETVLKEMDSEISTTLKQDSNEVRDGMETGICSYNLSTNKLYFAGAKRPLWVFSKSTDAYKLKEIVANKFSIGGFAESTDKIFTGHEIEVQKGDVVYMFSDGIIDQFDANNKKRIGTKRVREFISSIVHLPLNEQKLALEDFLITWRGQTAQTDDVLVIGIRF